MARARQTRRAAKKVLKVDTASKIAAMKKMLGNGNLTIVLVYADWCGACTRFKKSIWGPMSQRPALHNRIAIREDLVAQTPLAGSKYKYLPTIMVVDEAGTPQEVESPEGPTNAIPTPRSLEEMKRIVNLKMASAKTPDATPDATLTPTLEPMSLNMPGATPAARKSKMPEGIVYTPYPPAVAQRGGGLLEALEMVANVVIPAAALGTATVLAKRCKKTRRLRA